MIMDLIVASDANNTWLAGRRLPASEWETWPFHIPVIKVRESWPERLGLTEDGLENTPDNFNRQFPGLTRIGPYALDNNFMGRSWEIHIWEVRNLLLRFKDGLWANSFGLQAMLGVICEDAPWVAALDDFIVLPKESYGRIWTNGSGPNSDTRLDPADELVDANLPSPGATARFRTRMYGRRFIATCINFEERHWIAVLLDQVTNVLYLYDTWEHGRPRRARMAGLAWRSFALNLGMPCATRVVSVPLRSQPNGWICGYLALVNLTQSVRSIVGHSFDEVARGREAQFLGADGRAPGPVGDMPAPGRLLPTPDWGYGASDELEALSRANAVIYAMMFNQLGIRHLAEFRTRVNGREDPLNPCTEFQFVSGGLDGMPFRLDIEHVTQWPAKFRWSRVYPDDRTRHVCGGALPDSAFIPMENSYDDWRPFDDVLARNLSPGYLLVDTATLIRHRIRCWNNEISV